MFLFSKAVRHTTAAKLMFAAAGLGYDDLGSVAHTSYSDSASQMKDGHADFFTLGSSLRQGL